MPYKDPIKKKEYNKKWAEKNKVRIKELSKIYQEKNKGKLKEYREKYYQRKKEEIKRKTKEYYYKNKEKCLEKCREYYQKNKGKFKERNYTWKINNLENSRRIKEKYKAKKRLIVHQFTKADWRLKVLKTKGYCHKCGLWFGINKLEMDHIIPISKVPVGFVYTISDVQAICKSCNAKKGDKLPSYKKQKANRMGKIRNKSLEECSLKW